MGPTQHPIKNQSQKTRVSPFPSGTMMLRVLVLLAALVATAQAFMAPMPVRTTPVVAQQQQGKALASVNAGRSSRQGLVR